MQVVTNTKSIPNRFGLTMLCVYVTTLGRHTETRAGRKEDSQTDKTDNKAEEIYMMVGTLYKTA